MLNPETTPAPQRANSFTDSVGIGLLQAVLEQVDYGLAVVNVDTRQLLFANSPAWAALHPASTLQTDLWVAEGKLCTRQHSHTDQLLAALAQTKTGRRALINSVAVMPLSTLGMPPMGPSLQPQAVPAIASAPACALLVFPKQQLCDTTTITLFARERGLTGAEGQVLMAVCKGLRPQEIASHHGVQISTVRTQLRSIRQKTASDSVRELIAKVSGLPPMALHMHRLFEPMGASSPAMA